MPLKYDRDELYQKVWEKPLTKVAQEYGVSAVALGKVCRKLSVPVPGRGHWAKLAHGHRGAKKPPLPKLQNVPVVFRSTASEHRATTASDPEFAAIDQLLSSGGLKPSAEGTEPAQPHVLIRRTASRLRSRSRKNEQGILLPAEPGGLDVSVTASALDRALRVMSEVLSVLEKRNFSVEAPDKGGAVACINGQRVAFGVEEVIRSVVSQKARVANPTSRWDYDRSVSYEPTGTLALVIRSEVWPPEGLRRRWADGKTQRIEELIPDFVSGLMRTAIVMRRHEEESKKREEERRQRQQESMRLRELIEAEKKKLEELNQWIENWEKAERVRKFIAVYAEKTSTRAQEKQPQYKEWIAWANQQADRLDPFITEKPVSVLDRERELRSW
ncbi:MAG TPA: hypothetical protein VMT53_06700 [Terriglobales bacterium]|nr:hypothetical protein [Terriglobales bacterium]